MGNWDQAQDAQDSILDRRHYDGRSAQINKHDTDIALMKQNQQQHKEEINTMRAEFKDFQNDFRKLTQTVGDLKQVFTSIKYMGYGAMAFYTANTFGLDKALKLLIGVPG